MTSRSVSKRSVSLDHIMWLFMRLSVLAMFVLSLIGVGFAFALGARTQTDISTILRWMFFPNPSHVATSDIINIDAFINSFWQIMEILIAFFGITHGINGLRIVVEDYMSGHSWKFLLWRGFTFVLWLVISLISIYVILAS